LEDVLEELLQEEIYDEMDAAGRIPMPDDMEYVHDDDAGRSSYHLAGVV